MLVNVICWVEFNVLLHFMGFLKLVCSGFGQLTDRQTNPTSLFIFSPSNTAFKILTLFFL